MGGAGGSCKGIREESVPLPTPGGRGWGPAASEAVGIPWESKVTGLTLVSPSFCQRCFRTMTYLPLPTWRVPSLPRLTCRIFINWGRQDMGPHGVQTVPGSLVLTGGCQKSTKVPITPQRQWVGMSQDLGHRGKLMDHISLPSSPPVTCRTWSQH